jgi:hypothetical protein
VTREQFRMLIAHHESAHAVVALIGGLRLVSTEIREGTDENGEWGIDGITYVEYHPSQPLAFALQGAAGEAAAFQWLEKQGLPLLKAASADHDREDVIAVLAEDGFQIGLTEREPGDAAWSAIRLRASRKVQMLWPEITAVASALVEKGHLAGAEVALLVCSTSATAPTRSFC